MAKTSHVYLDWNATAPVRASASEAAREAIPLAANPSSVHAPGRRARALLEAARESVARLGGVEASRVVFTSGGTESNGMAILGAVESGAARRLIVSAIEHDSVIETAKLAAARYSIPFDIVRVTSDGTVDLADLERSLASSSVTPLVSIMAANNETGAVQPLDEVVALARKHKAVVHTDAVQIAGRLPFDASRFDLVTLSAHKIGGIAGAGALLVSDAIDLAALYGGGKQEAGRRPGTEPLAAIAAFGAAAREAGEQLPLVAALGALRDEMEARLLRDIPELVVFGAGAPRLPQTSCLGLPGTAAETQVIVLDLAGIAVSAGSACSSGKVHKSHVLGSMGASDAAARSAIRVSFGVSTRAEDLHQFTDVWMRQLRRSASLMLRQAQHEGDEKTDALILSLSKDERPKRAGAV